MFQRFPVLFHSHFMHCILEIAVGTKVKRMKLLHELWTGKFALCKASILRFLINTAHQSFNSKSIPLCHTSPTFSARFPILDSNGDITNGWVDAIAASRSRQSLSQKSFVAESVYEI